MLPLAGAVQPTDNKQGEAGRRLTQDSSSTTT